jgi:hypothetical protein
MGRIKYRTRNWYLCGHIKILGVLLGQQGGYTKFPYFLCEWDITARDIYWATKDCPKREDLIPESKNIVHVSLVEIRKFYYPSCT